MKFMKKTIYECYCEPTKKPQYISNNFSLIIACNKRPSKKKLEEILKDELNVYHICYITDDICLDLNGITIKEVNL